MASLEESRLSSEQLAELSALADGSLDRSRRPDVQSMIAGSPELRELYEGQRRALELLAEASRTVRAPARLRAELRGPRPRAKVRARRRAGYGGALAAALAAAVAALTLLLPLGTPGLPSLSEAAGLAARGASHPAPAVDARDSVFRLDRRVDGLYFPNWEPTLGWRAVGQRSDRLGVHRAITVYYRWADTRIAYTIVSAPALAQPPARVIQRRGIELRVLTVNGRVVITWRRAGDTCVLSGNRVSAGELESLAGWKPPAISSE